MACCAPEVQRHSKPLLYDAELPKPSADVAAQVLDGMEESSAEDVGQEMDQVIANDRDAPQGDTVDTHENEKAGANET